MDGQSSHQIILGMSASNKVKQVSIIFPLQDFSGALLCYAPWTPNWEREQAEFLPLLWPRGSFYNKASHEASLVQS